jgi:hypothetical protein
MIDIAEIWIFNNIILRELILNKFVLLSGLKMNINFVLLFITLRFINVFEEMFTLDFV